MVMSNLPDDGSKKKLMETLEKFIHASHHLDKFQGVVVESCTGHVHMIHAGASFEYCWCRAGWWTVLRYVRVYDRAGNLIGQFNDAAGVWKVGQ